MSGIRSPSGVTPTAPGSAKSPASGQGPITSAAPIAPAGDETNSPSGAPQPKNTEVLRENTTVNAIVMAKSASDNIVLHTEFGNYRVTTPTPLNVGSHILFEVIASQEVILAKLLTMDGEDFSPPLEVRLLPTVQKSASVAKDYLKAGQLHPHELKAGLQNLSVSLPATVKPPVPQPALVPPPLAAKEQSGTTSSAMITTGFSSTGIEGQRQANPQGLIAYQRYHSPSLQTPQAGPPQNVTPIINVPNLPNASRYQVVEADILRAQIPSMINTSKGSPAIAAGEKINLIVRPQQATGSLTPNSNIYPGTVIALAKSPIASGPSRVTLQTPLGTLSFSTSTPPTTGTTVQFAVADEIAVFPLPETDIQIPGQRLPKIEAMGDWQNLREALNLVARHDPIVVQNVISQIIPQANSQLSSSLIFFMAALNLGSVEKWLGQEFTHALKSAGHSSRLLALEEDFATFSRLQSENGGHDWKSLNFPFFDGENLRQIRMFHRQHKSSDEMDPEKDTTRFVIELNLSKSGQVQLDGLFKNSLFDLAVRSHQDMPEDMRLNIGKLFNQHIEISGLKGKLIFRTISPFPVDPLDEWESNSDASQSH